MNQATTDKQRAFSFNRQAGSKQAAAANSASAAAAAASGGYLRPKVLDFQPKMGQVDPLMANRSKYRGPSGSTHTQAASINVSTSSGFHGHGGTTGTAQGRFQNPGGGGNFFKHF